MTSQRRFHVISAVIACAASAPLAGVAAAQSASPDRTFILPYLGSAPETGLQYGGTVYRLHHTADSATRPSTAQLFSSYTVKHQFRIFLETDRWSAGNQWHTIGHLEWQKFPLPFNGFGDATPDSAEEIYTPRGLIVNATVQRRVHGNLFATGGYDFRKLTVVGTAESGALRAGMIPGSRGERVGQLRGGLQWDSRDDVFASRRGSFVQATGSIAARATGSEFTFNRLVLDARRFVPLGGERVLALQAVAELTDGGAPFDQVSLVGSSNYLRGYTRGRFRDRDLAAAQLEYRAPLPWRFGGVAFAGAGRIAPDAGRLLGAGPRTLPSYGLGLRRTLFAGSRSDIRVDYARGAAGQGGLYVALNEAF